MLVQDGDISKNGMGYAREILKEYYREQEQLISEGKRSYPVDYHLCEGMRKIIEVVANAIIGPDLRPAIDESIHLPRCNLHFGGGEVVQYYYRDGKLQEKVLSKKKNETFL